MSRNHVHVVAAVIENEANEIFCALRSATMKLPKLWEFPGGKVEVGEDAFTALKREIKEELSCEVELADEIFQEVIYDYPTFTINLTAIKAKLKHGMPSALEHSAVIWLKPDYLETLNWAPADLPIVEALQKETNGSQL
ncbi:8-oxo-dGTP diphosphatase [Streptohalobacillus salinus]|uniref:8-oxo-dGTP diphosphatase n=1 Tax=Streptohalobacillus salinus TaxID=621096 RepID=A0A2V3WEW0_9BACI|nr:(deoxy)nucleoside triphosphate pyrophosphohydrolase [Streptohalobacillus salinus]PXW93183.1 8-oxo-dGTP diphosphatase [Streptohalobacillus salinus]